MTKAPPTTSTSVLDPQLARLIDDITAKLQSGQQVDVSAILHDHPEHADDLREILPTLAALGDLSNSGSNGVAHSPIGLDDSTGTLGDFRLIRELGRGGMGVVYEALQISLNRRVALKVLPFAATMDPKHLQRFRNEAMAAASLRHENIVHVYGVGCERSVHFYAMEMIDGQTLAQIIAALHHQPQRRDATSDYQPTDAAAPTAPVGALSTEFSGIKGRELHRLAARLMADAADALEHAHSLGIVHRDIKPGNLMVDAAGKVYVTDFGLARFVPPPSQGGAGEGLGLTMSGDLLGTLRYMSPEQAMARHGLVDHRTDVYSLGATLYELLTGRPAVVGEDKQEVLKHIAFEEPTPLRKIDKSIPVELETITMKALAKEPGERYSTAKELSEDLRRWGEDRAIKARRPTIPQRVARWARRHPGWTAAMGVVFGLLLALSWAWHRETANAEKAALTVALESDQLRDANRITEALQAARRAVDLLPRIGGDAALRRVVTERVADIQLLNQLDEALLACAEIGIDGDWNRERQASLFQKAFLAYGVDILGGDETAVIETLRHRSVATEVAATLFEWSALSADAGSKMRLSRLAEALDTDPRQFLVQIRRAKEANDVNALRRLASEARAELPKPEVIFRLGMALYEASAITDAERLFKAGLLRYPADFWLNYTLGYMIYKSGPAKAVDCTRYSSVALALRPSSPIAWDSFIASLGTAERHDEAEAAARRAIELNPHFAKAHLSLGLVLANKARWGNVKSGNMQNLEEAETEFRRAISLKPDLFWAHGHLGYLLSQRGRHEEAEAAFRHAIAVNAKFEPAYFQLGSLLLEQKHFAKAETVLLRAVELNPNDESALGNLGIAYKGLGRHADAEAAFRRAIALNPKSALAYLNLGTLHQEIGRHADAVSEFRRAIDAEPTLAEKISYDAACSASIACCGRGDAATLSDSERSQLRQQALDLLTADLGRWKKRADNAAEIPKVRRTILRWQKNPDLAGVRDTAAIDKLPEAERDAWKKLWADVAELLERTKDTAKTGM